MNLYAILLLQMLVAGATHIFAKSVTGSVETVPLTFLRSIISTLGLLLLLAVREKSWRIEKRDWPRLLWLGFLAIPANQLLYLYGIKFTTAANGALLYATTPVFVLILSGVMLKEHMTIKKVVGVLLAFLGVVIVVFERGLDFSGDYTYGNVVILVAVVSWALFTIQGRPLIFKYGALKTTSVAMILGTILFFPVGVVSTMNYPVGSISLGDWGSIFYLAIGTSIIGYVLWYYALGRIEASKVAVFANGQPILATILAMIFLDYAITGNFVVGGTVTISGVVLTQLS